MLDQEMLSTIERAGNAVTAGMLVQLRREVRKDKTRSQVCDLGSEKTYLHTMSGFSAHAWIDTCARTR